MARFRAFMVLPSVLALEVAALVVLHGLGEVPALRPATVVAPHAPAADAVMAAARLLALAVAWWLLATTVLCVLARACRLPAALRALEPVTLPAVRRLAERSIALTLSLSAGVVTVPALPAGATNVPAPVAAAASAVADAGAHGTALGLGGEGQSTLGRGGERGSAPGLGGGRSPILAPVVRDGTVLPPALAGANPPPGARPVRETPAPPAARLPAGHRIPAALPGAPPEREPARPREANGAVLPPAAGVPYPPITARVTGTAPAPGTSGLPDANLPRQHRIAEGEHLWALAQAVVGRSTGRPADQVPAAEVAAYWVRIVEANPSGLRSGDPDVVYPGETVRLPPLDG